MSRDARWEDMVTARSGCCIGYCEAAIALSCTGVSFCWSEFRLPALDSLSAGYATQCK